MEKKIRRSFLDVIGIKLVINNASGDFKETVVLKILSSERDREEVINLSVMRMNEITKEVSGVSE